MSETQMKIAELSKQMDHAEGPAKSVYARSAKKLRIMEEQKLGDRILSANAYIQQRDFPEAANLSLAQSAREFVNYCTIFLTSEDFSLEQQTILLSLIQVAFSTRAEPPKQVEVVWAGLDFYL